jgi:molecular chaperone GrpE
MSDEHPKDSQSNFNEQPESTEFPPEEQPQGQGQRPEGGEGEHEVEIDSEPTEPGAPVEGEVDEADGPDNAEPEMVEVSSADLKKMEDDLVRYRELALRSQAELDNFRKRMSREKEEARRYANRELIETLLPVIDNFEYCLVAAESSEDKNIVMGMTMVMKQVKDFLAEMNVEVVDAAGKAFDPAVHEAMGQEPSDEVGEGVVLRQLRKGYRLGDRLIRPANVIVSSGAPKAGEGEEQTAASTEG